jgi:hypothetical protein
MTKGNQSNHSIVEHNHSREFTKDTNQSLFVMSEFYYLNHFVILATFF